MRWRLALQPRTAVHVEPRGVNVPVEVIRNLIQCFSCVTRSQSEASWLIIEEGRIEHFTFSDWTCSIAIPEGRIEHFTFSDWTCSIAIPDYFRGRPEVSDQIEKRFWLKVQSACAR